MAGNAARLGQFADRVAAPQEHLDHPQPMRMGQRLEAFRRLRQSIQRRELGPTDRFRLGQSFLFSLHSNISEYSDLSIIFS